MKPGPEKPVEAAHRMESYKRELVGLVESGRSMMDAEVLRLSREIDHCINLICRESLYLQSSLGVGAPAEPGSARLDSSSKKAASASPSSKASLPLIM
jgi:hypothetical protein